MKRSSDAKQASQSVINGFNLSIEQFYQTYSIYWDGDMHELGDLIDKEDPTNSLERCVMWVEDLHNIARRKNKRQLADVQGVRIYCSLTNLTRLLTLNLVFHRSICSLMNMTLSAITTLIPITTLFMRAPRLKQCSLPFGPL